MFKINAEELKREIQEKMARLKKIDEELQKVAPANTEREKEIKKWMKRWEAYRFYNSEEYKTAVEVSEELEEDAQYLDPAYSALACNIHEDD